MLGRFKSSPLKDGDDAPDFTLPDQDGNDLRLHDLLRAGPVVLYFYPKAFTTVCTAEACAFRDSHEAFRDVGASVVGISTDSVATQKKFHDKYRLNYPLLSDRDGTVHKLFGVRNGGGGGVGFVFNDRITFVIDGDGVVRHRFGGLLVADPHIRESLKIVESLVAGQDA
jgi:peroxiredoxin Q/BCP